MRPNDLDSSKLLEFYIGKVDETGNPLPGNEISKVFDLELNHLRLSRTPWSEKMTTGCRYWGGKIAFEWLNCLLVSTEMEDPGCLVYRTSESCHVCKPGYFIDYMRRGKCRSIEEGCLSDKGFLRLP